MTTSGAKHFESLLANRARIGFSAFVDPGAVIIAEAPTFSGTLNTGRRHGPAILAVPLDVQGIVTDAVRERLEALRRQGRRAKLIYTIVNFQNPAGMCQSLRRRQDRKSTRLNSRQL